MNILNIFMIVAVTANIVLAIVDKNIHSTIGWSVATMWVLLHLYGGK